MDEFPARVHVTDELRRYLEKFDSPNHTPGRQRILEAFVEMASTEGYPAVTMRTLGAKLGLKAPSIYSHFDGGRDEIVTEAYRWFSCRFTTAVLAAIDEALSVDDFWDSLVRVHLQLQLQSPESDMWDILLATDRLSQFLRRDTRRQLDDWAALYEQMFVVAAIEMGFGGSEVEKRVRVVIKILDSANEWCNWDGSDTHLQLCVDNAIAISRSLLSVDMKTVLR